MDQIGDLAAMNAQILELPVAHRLQPLGRNSLVMFLAKPLEESLGASKHAPDRNGGAAVPTDSCAFQRCHRSLCISSVSRCDRRSHRPQDRAKRERAIVSLLQAFYETWYLPQFTRKVCQNCNIRPEDGGAMWQPAFEPAWNFAGLPWNLPAH
jgi:hypothetical protein